MIMALTDLMAGIRAIFETWGIVTNFFSTNGIILSVCGIFTLFIFVLSDNDPIATMSSTIPFFAACIYNHWNYEKESNITNTETTQETTNIMKSFRKYTEDEEDHGLYFENLEKFFEKNNIDETKLLDMHIDTLLKKLQFQSDHETNVKRFITTRALIRKEIIEQTNKIKKIALNPFKVKELSWDQVAQLLHAEIKANTDEQFEKWCTFLERNTISGQVLLKIKPEQYKEYMMELGLVIGQKVLFETMMETINETNKNYSSSPTTLKGISTGVLALHQAKVTAQTINNTTNKYNTDPENKRNKNKNPDDEPNGSAGGTSRTPISNAVQI